VHRTLARLAADGATVILSSHRMDDLEELCSEVTILVTGRVTFSGPLDKLAGENRELDYRLMTSDNDAARQAAAETDGITVVDDAGGAPNRDVLVVRALVPALDQLVPRLVQANIAVRELAPVVSPLETAFLALTERQESTESQESGQ
jgi:ABC-2 type transport system ATP-binding protein